MQFCPTRSAYCFGAALRHAGSQNPAIAGSARNRAGAAGLSAVRYFAKPSVKVRQNLDSRSRCPVFAKRAEQRRVGAGSKVAVHRASIETGKQQKALDPRGDGFVRQAVGPADGWQLKDASCGPGSALGRKVKSRLRVAKGQALWGGGKRRRQGCGSACRTLIRR